MKNQLRLNDRSGLFLSLLASHQHPLCGLDIVSHSNGAIKRGSVFALASSLEADGLISSRKEEDETVTIPRRLYALTEKGEIALHAWNKIQQLDHLLSDRNLVPA